MARFCSSCGTQMADNAAFCPSCGKASVAGATGAAPAPAQVAQGSAAPVSGLQDNVAGLLAYLFIPAIIFLVIEPYNRNRFIRFHALQGVFFHIAWVVVWGVTSVFVMVPFLGWAVFMVVHLGMTITWLVLMIKAFQGTMFKLPTIGDLAEKQAGVL